MPTRDSRFSTICGHSEWSRDSIDRRVQLESETLNGVEDWWRWVTVNDLLVPKFSSRIGGEIRNVVEAEHWWSEDWVLLNLASNIQTHSLNLPYTIYLNNLRPPSWIVIENTNTLTLLSNLSTEEELKSICSRNAQIRWGTRGLTEIFE